MKLENIVFKLDIDTVSFDKSMQKMMSTVDMFKGASVTTYREIFEKSSEVTNSIAKNIDNIRNSKQTEENSSIDANINVNDGQYNVNNKIENIDETSLEELPYTESMDIAFDTSNKYNIDAIESTNNTISNTKNISSSQNYVAGNINTENSISNIMNQDIDTNVNAELDTISNVNKSNVIKNQSSTNISTKNSLSNNRQISNVKNTNVTDVSSDSVNNINQNNLNMNINNIQTNDNQKEIKENANIIATGKLETSNDIQDTYTLDTNNTVKLEGTAPDITSSYRNEIENNVVNNDTVNKMTDIVDNNQYNTQDNNINNIQDIFENVSSVNDIKGSISNNMNNYSDNVYNNNIDEFRNEEEDDEDEDNSKVIDDVMNAINSLQMHTPPYNNDTANIKREIEDVLGNIKDKFLSELTA